MVAADSLAYNVALLALKLPWFKSGVVVAPLAFKPEQYSKDGNELGEIIRLSFSSRPVRTLRRDGGFVLHYAPLPDHTGSSGGVKVTLRTKSTSLEALFNSEGKNLNGNASQIAEFLRMQLVRYTILGDFPREWKQYYGLDERPEDYMGLSDIASSEYPSWPA